MMTGNGGMVAAAIVDDNRRACANFWVTKASRININISIISPACHLIECVVHTLCHMPRDDAGRRCLDSLTSGGNCVPAHNSLSWIVRCRIHTRPPWGVNLRSVVHAYPRFPSSACVPRSALLRLSRARECGEHSPHNTDVQDLVDLTRRKDAEQRSPKGNNDAQQEKAILACATVVLKHRLLPFDGEMRPSRRR